MKVQINTYITKVPIITTHSLTKHICRYIQCTLYIVHTYGTVIYYQYLFINLDSVLFIDIEEVV